MIFVFGSNLAGRHGKGAALTAIRDYGAVYGQGIGRAGNSYAIPTKDSYLRPLELDEIEFYINAFIEYAKKNSQLEFQITKVGCGLAGYKDNDIRPLFTNVPNNCYLPIDWRE